MIAFASCVLDKAFFLSSIAIHSKLNGSGYRLTYPTKKIGGQNLSLFHPINSDTAKGIETAILKKLNDVMENSNDRHHRTYAESA
jgi:stage V sporulation protein G